MRNPVWIHLVWDTFLTSFLLALPLYYPISTLALVQAVSGGIHVAPQLSTILTSPSVIVPTTTTVVNPSVTTQHVVTSVGSQNYVIGQPVVSSGQQILTSLPTQSFVNPVDTRSVLTSVNGQTFLSPVQNAVPVVNPGTVQTQTTLTTTMGDPPVIVTSGNPPVTTLTISNAKNTVSQPVTVLSMASGTPITTVGNFPTVLSPTGTTMILNVNNSNITPEKSSNTTKSNS
uniref:Uncharacterized protein n=1 Tax=Cacopsylla melanoneura TaxID=428564 RepID=A0A8D8Q313_9HEMI